MSAEAKMNESISCLITPTELAHIDQLVVRTGQTRSEWLQSLVQSALSETPTNIRHLTERVASLEQKLADMAELQRQVKQLTQTIDLSSTDPSPNLNKSFNPEEAPVQAASASLSPSPQESAAARPTSGQFSTGSIYDDVEDGPCEILHEFLEPEPSSSKASPIPQAPVNQSIYDVDEDDPDEILYDFLEDSDRPF